MEPTFFLVNYRHDYMGDGYLMAYYRNFIFSCILPSIYQISLRLLPVFAYSFGFCCIRSKSKLHFETVAHLNFHVQNSFCFKLDCFKAAELHVGHAICSLALLVCLFGFAVVYLFIYSFLSYIILRRVQKATGVFITVLTISYIYSW